MKSNLLIKNFGKDLKCESIDILVENLSSYIGMHISIVKTLNSGIKKIFFVFVKDDKTLINSYTNKVVTFSEISQCF